MKTILFLNNSCYFYRVLIRKSDNEFNETLLNRNRFSTSRNDSDESIQINEISSTETNVFAKRSEQKGISCDKRKHTDSSVINTNSYNFRLKQKLG